MRQAIKRTFTGLLVVGCAVAVGFDGVGGSFLSNPVKIAKRPPLRMVEQALSEPYSEIPQIATLPTETLTK